MFYMLRANQVDFSIGCCCLVLVFECSSTSLFGKFPDGEKPSGSLLIPWCWSEIQVQVRAFERSTQHTQTHRKSQLVILISKTTGVQIDLNWDCWHLGCCLQYLFVVVVVVFKYTPISVFSFTFFCFEYPPAILSHPCLCRPWASKPSAVGTDSTIRVDGGWGNDCHGCPKCTLCL